MIRSEYPSLFLLPVSIAFFALFSTGCLSQTSKGINYSSAILVDVRTPEEFAEGSVDGAVNIPLSELPQRLVELKGSNDIVLFCRSGSRSSQAIQILQQNGIEGAINGGTWQQVRDVLKNQKK